MKESEKREEQEHLVEDMKCLQCNKKLGVLIKKTGVLETEILMEKKKIKMIRIGKS